MQFKSAKFQLQVFFLKTFFLVLDENIGLNLQTSSGTDPKPRKTYYFHKEWKDYFFIMFNSRCVCLICYASISLPKKGKLERHLTTMNKRYEKDFPVRSELRKTKLKGIEITTSYTTVYFYQAEYEK